MLQFTRAWVNEQMNGLWEEMVGIRPTLLYRYAGQQPPNTGPSDLNLTYAERWVPFSDLTAARLIQLQMDDRLTVTGEERSARWYFWNGVFHEEIKSGVIGDWITEAFTDQVVMAMDAVNSKYQADIAAADARSDRQEVTRLQKQYKELFKEHRMYQSKLHSDAGLNSLKSRLRKQVTKESTYFDNDHRWLVCQNGVIDLEEFKRTRRVEKLLPHSPLRPVTRCVEANFDRNATAPTWEHFLETSQPDEELRLFMQRLVGAAFLGESKVKAIPNLVGPKDCGKSVFVTLLDKLAGGYGEQPSPSALMVKRGGDNWEQETLRGKRFVGVSEPNPNDLLDDTFCKQVTGGDIVHTRSLYSASSGWVAQCVIFIASNKKVRFNTQDEAFVDRLCFIEFPHRFWDITEAEPGEIHIKDPELEDKMLAEADGVLQWVFWGMWRFLSQGMDTPESVKKAGADTVVDASPALSWIREKIEDGLLLTCDQVADNPASHYVLLNHLYSQYKSDAEADGDRRPLGKHAFSKHLQNKYGDIINSGGRRVPRIMGANMWSTMNEKEWSGWV